jgi:NADPH:quinone reductase
MKAIVCRRYGGPDVLELADVPDLVPGPREVVVDVRACAINLTDLLTIENSYQYPQELPFVPGGEASGVVRLIGAEVDSVSVGDHVIAAGTTGGFAEQKCVPASRISVIPAGLDFVSAVGLMYSYGTVLYGLQELAQMSEGASLLVLGAGGGVGLAAVEVGKLLGARVIACASTDAKLAACAERGADALVNYESEDIKTRVRELTGGAGADVVLDPVGGKYAEPALRATAWGGHYLVVGFAGGIPSIPLNYVLLRGARVSGVFMGSFMEREPSRGRLLTAQVRDWWVSGAIKPYVWQEFPLSQTTEALRLLDQRQVVGRAVITPDSQA